MSIQNDLRIRLDIQRGDELIYVTKLYDEYLYFSIGFGTRVKNRKCKMDGNVIVRRKNGKTGMYTSKGEIVIPEDNHICETRFFDDGEVSREVILVSKDGLYEVYSYDGKQQIVPRICEAVYLYATHITIRKDGYIYVYSYEGKQIIPMELTLKDEYIQNDESALICVNRKGLTGVYSGTGELIIPFERQRISYKKPFFEVTKANWDTELYSFSGRKLFYGSGIAFQWSNNTENPIFSNKKVCEGFIVLLKGGKSMALYTYEGKKVIDELHKYSKMYLEKEYIICIGIDQVSMDVYNFEGQKIAQINS